MTKKAEVKQGKGTVEASKKEAGGPEQPLLSKKLPVPDEPGVYTQPVANVGFGITHTINLGNYESIKLSVDVHLPCYANEIDEVYAYGKEWVEARFEEAMEELSSNIKDAE